MTNPILSNINSAFQAQQVSIAESYDLNDNRFSNILDNKLNDLNGVQEAFSNEEIVNKLGIPAGLQIEGFDYNSIAQELVNSTDKIEQINTDSDIQNQNSFDINTLIQQNPNDTLSSNNYSTNPLKSVQKFWENQASNFYSTMNKHTVDDITELLSKLN